MTSSWDITWTQERVLVKEIGKDAKWTYELVSPPYCEKCGRHLAGRKICWDTDRHTNLNSAEKVFLMGFYFPNSKIEFQDDEDILSQHILRLKSNRRFAEPIGTAMALTMANNYKEMLDADLLVPIPSYGTDNNNAHALCQVISEHLQKYEGLTIPVQIALKKIKDITLHTLPTRKDRIDAVKNMFEPSSNISINKKKIVLVDDLLTTGDAKSQCIRILEMNGAGKIWVFVAAGNV